MERKYHEGKLLQVGDVINVRDGKSILARLITVFMKIYKRKMKLDEDVPPYHHSGLIIEVWGRLFIAEAVARGFKIHSLDDAYSQHDWLTRIDITRPNRQLNQLEEELMCRLCTRYVMNITRYDTFNFIHHAWYVLTGKWIGPKGIKAENRFYCSEMVATVYNYIREGTFKDPASTNPVEVAINQNFHSI